MIVNLYPLDSTAFRWVNGTASNPVFDAVMPFITEPRNPFLIVPLALLFLYALWRWRRDAIWCAVLLAVTITLSDQLSSTFIKQWVGRERPCHALAEVRELMPCGGGKSFPSSHATNIAAAAVIVGALFRRTRPYGAALAAAVIYSRVYVGAHYPADVLGGAVIGGLVALGVLALRQWALRRWGERPVVEPV